MSGRVQGKQIKRAIPDFGIGKEKLAELSKEIKKMHEEQKQSSDDFDRMLDILESFEDYLRNKGIVEKLRETECVFHRVVPYGSAVTDLATKNCDLDMCIVVESDNLQLNCAELLQWVKELLETKGSPFPEECTYEFIPARVPIIRVKGKTLEIDISAHKHNQPPTNYLAVQLFNAYSQLDDRFAPLCVFVRQWFKKFHKDSTVAEENAKKTPSVIPNSYSTTILVIHFMQYYSILPNLFYTHASMFDPRKQSWKNLIDWDVEEYPFTDKDKNRLKNRICNPSSCLGSLFVAFLDYYTNVVSLPSEVIVGSKGKTEEKRRIKGEMTRGLIILDSYDLKNPGRRVEDTIALEAVLKKGLESIVELDHPQDLIKKLWEVEIDFETARVRRQHRRNGPAKFFDPWEHYAKLEKGREIMLAKLAKAALSEE